MIYINKRRTQCACEYCNLFYFNDASHYSFLEAGAGANMNQTFSFKQFNAFLAQQTKSFYPKI